MLIGPRSCGMEWRSGIVPPSTYVLSRQHYICEWTNQRWAVLICSLWVIVVIGSHKSNSWRVNLQLFSRFCISQNTILCTTNELGKYCNQVSLANQMFRKKQCSLENVIHGMKHISYRWVRNGIESSIEDSCKFRPMILQIKCKRLTLRSIESFKFISQPKGK